MKYAVKKLVNHNWQFVAMVNFEPITLRKWLDFYHKNDYKLFIKILEVFLTDGEIEDLELHQKFEIDIETFYQNEKEITNIVIYGDNGLINIVFDKTYKKINTIEDLKKQALKEF
jgi:hypothetical protein